VGGKISFLFNGKNKLYRPITPLESLFTVYHSVVSVKCFCYFFPFSFGFCVDHFDPGQKLILLFTNRGGGPARMQGGPASPLRANLSTNQCRPSKRPEHLDHRVLLMSRRATPPLKVLSQGTHKYFSELKKSIFHI